MIAEDDQRRCEAAHIGKQVVPRIQARTSARGEPLLDRRPKLAPRTVAEPFVISRQRLFEPRGSRHGARDTGRASQHRLDSSGVVGINGPDLWGREDEVSSNFSSAA
jgi:hypothetical protein